MPMSAETATASVFFMLYFAQWIITNRHLPPACTSSTLNIACIYLPLFSLSVYFLNNISFPDHSDHSGKVKWVQSLDFWGQTWWSGSNCTIMTVLKCGITYMYIYVGMIDYVRGGMDLIKVIL